VKVKSVYVVYLFDTAGDVFVLLCNIYAVVMKEYMVVLFIRFVQKVQISFFSEGYKFPNYF